MAAPQPKNPEARTDRHAASDPDQWVDLHGDALYRFALVRIGNRAAAEDIVQETFLAALRSRERFEGAAAERTWLLAILKRRMIDRLRRMNTEAAAKQDAKSGGGFFSKRGKWLRPPVGWAVDPAVDLEQRELLAILRACMAKLPRRELGAITMREFDGRESDNICEALGVTSTNLWTILHRARLRLRECLERNWFKSDKRGPGAAAGSRKTAGHA